MRLRLRNIRVFHISADTCRLEAEIGADQKRPLLSFLETIAGKDVSAELSKWTHKRSAEANKYAWVLIDKIAAETRQPPLDVYRQCIREIGGVSDILTMRTDSVETFIRNWRFNGDGWQAEIFAEAKTPGFTHVRAYYGSRTYDTAQMSRLIDSLVQDAKELGIETLPPDELERMVGRWQSTDKQKQPT